MKERYIALMAKALEAYSDAHIVEYFERVKREGLIEHGFPRLTANIGILIAHGYRGDLLPLFLEMMEFCCATMPRVKAANDFSVKEIIFCILALKEKEAVENEQIERWLGYMRTVDPKSTYNVIAWSEDATNVFNWALFSTVSEQLREYAGLTDAQAFVDSQMPPQLIHLDENSMYRDAFVHPPMVYDLVSRGLFSVLLHFGYKGKYADVIEEHLRKSALLSLDMQSVTGEIPYGGRSMQFLHNEPHLAAIFEYEARRYAKEGNKALAGRFKAAAARAIGDTEKWLSLSPIYHIKNRFSPERGYKGGFGCEDYAYFDKYMITVASFLYAAYLLADDEILPSDERQDVPRAFTLSDDFHKVFLRAGSYFTEFDTSADPHYDASGLGRIHREGAPSTIALSVPCPASPNYFIGDEERIDLSFAPALKEGDAWLFATNASVKYELSSLIEEKETASAAFVCRFGEKTVSAIHCVSDSGVTVSLSGEGEIGYLLPAFDFDGEAKTTVTQSEGSLSIAYGGWECRYTTDGAIIDLGKTGANRNGVYRAFLAEGKDSLTVKIEILRA